MSYVIEQRIKNHIYLYEISSYWDKEKKQARQRRKYLGKKDESTKEPITPRKLPVVASAVSYGHLYLLSQLTSDIGLYKVLSDVFSVEQVEALLGLAYFQILESKPWYLYTSWSEDNGLKDTPNLNSQRISDLLHELGQNEEAINRFFHHWASHQKPLKGVWLDITSLSSYSQNNNWVEWGYNRDGESLPQVNLGVLLGGARQLPFFYQMYPGSIADVSTLHNVTLRAKDLGFDIETWVMDRGFFSTSNITHLESQGYQFITTMPLTLKEAQRLLAGSKAALRSPLGSFCLGKEALFVQDTTCQVGTQKLRACIYLNEKRRAQETEAFIRRLDSLEQMVTSMTFEDLDAVHEWLNRQWKGSTNFYTVTLREDGTLGLKRKRNALSFRLNRMGKMILVTNRTDLSPKELLEQYRNKDRVEKVYDTLKNSLNENRLRVHSVTTMTGKMFITFLSLIIQTALMNQMTKSGLTQVYSLPEVIMELKKIRLFTRSNNQPSFLSEISKKQRDIFTKLLIPIPVPPPRY